ncbi:glycosyltransferase involved in cell wall biosynthesis [Pantoea ananatis]|uniref:glycosyltransferase family 2 protein n=1 Tax=Pantoea ananas TaxID=553 RepID=UPI000D7716BB|nr:glycosyltransferase family A protein [Pantoea ananatis]PXW03753.1 glycosyltransferase involved in cell wall biosynthesis [Pantoea ananatis]
MNDKYLFSIIIPVYNAEKTVMRTLQSLLLQTFKNYEIILVNDGSKDNCAAILEEFKQYNNFKVITQDNAGVSVARNTGLEAASGDYVILIDSDDWVDSDFLAVFHQHLYSGIPQPVDLMVGNLKCDRVGDLSTYGYFTQPEIPAVLGEIELSDNIGYLHNKCYRKKIIDDFSIRFTKGISMSEDLLFNLNYFYYIDNLFVFDSASYHYDDVENSLSKKRVLYEELLDRKHYLNDLYQRLLVKYKNGDMARFSTGITKRKLTLDMQIVTAMYYTTLNINEVRNSIKRIKEKRYPENVLGLLNRSEKVKYHVMNVNARAAYLVLYMLYRLRFF